MKTYKNIYKLLTVIIILFLSSFLTAQNRNVNTYEAKPGGTIEVELVSGGVKLRSWNKNKIQIKSYLTNAFGKNYKIVENDNLFLIKVKSFSGSANNYAFEITVPEKFNVKVTTSSGDIKSYSHIKGNIDLTTMGGEIRLSDLSGNININSLGGEIRTGVLTGKSIIATQGGEINIDGISDGPSSIKTNGGDIRLNSIDGECDAITYSGDIRVITAAGEVQLKSLSGDIRISNSSGSLSASTNAGDLRVIESKGEVNFETLAGDLKVLSHIGNFNLKTSSGDITVNLLGTNDGNSEAFTKNGEVKLMIDENADAKITAIKTIKGSWDNARENILIKTNFQVASEEENRNKKEFSYIINLNKADSKIRLKSNNGDITVKKLMGDK